MVVNLSPRTVYTQVDLVCQLGELGLCRGDTVLVRVDFGKMGRVQRPADRTLIESLLAVVGSGGTVLAVTHSPVQWTFRRDRSYVFDSATAPTVIGRFAEALLQWPGVVRSQHPTCSMAGIGASANDLLQRHDHRATTHEPIKHLIAAGKLLVIGCVFSSPGFSTVHYVHEELGLATRSLLSGLIGCYFKYGDTSSWFSQQDIPGCSLGFHKFYPLYEAKSVLRKGTIGTGEAILINASDAAAVERVAVRTTPSFSLCDNPRCYSCRGTKLFNLGDMPRYYLTQMPRAVIRRLTRRNR